MMIYENELEEPAVTHVDDSSLSETEESREELVVTPVDDSSVVDQSEEEPEEVSRLLNDPGEAAAEVTGDTLILAQLEVIDSHLQSNLTAVDTVNSNIASFALDFNRYASARDEKEMYIIGYLHILLITLFTVLGVFFISKLAKWIENLICDR